MSTYIIYVQNIFYINIIEKQINQFSLGYMINPTLHVNKVFRYQVEKSLKEKFHQITMKGIKNVMRKKDSCVIALKNILWDFNNKNKFIGC